MAILRDWTSSCRKLCPDLLGFTDLKLQFAREAGRESLELLKTPCLSYGRFPKLLFPKWGKFI